MITAVDTNILLDILLPNEEFVERSAQALQEAAASGSLVICDIVYAEVSVHFPTQAECDAFLNETGVRVEALDRKAGFLAGKSWRTYRKQGGKRSRILGDFLVGAHAQVQASQLLSRDRGFYGQMFPSLNLIDPSTFPRK